MVWARSVASTWGDSWFGWPRAGTCSSPPAGRPCGSLHLELEQGGRQGTAGVGGGGWGTDCLPSAIHLMNAEG